MRFTSLIMYISARCIFVFYVYVGFCHAAPGVSHNDASPLSRKPDSAAPEAGEIATTPRKRLLMGLTPAHGGVSAGLSTTLSHKTATTFQPPRTDPTRPAANGATPDSSRSSSHRRRSTDGQASLFTPDKSLQTLISMVSQRSANDAWAADRSPFTSVETNQENLCNCSTGAEGIEDPEECDQNTGQCLCMSGYTGLQCEDCEEAYFTNGTSGCLPCACDSFGAVSHLCDSSGTCVCKTGIYGPKCDECHPGFFHFSSTGCRPCQCNNHTSYCHPQSGVCLNCEGNTQGSNCEECRTGFYRSPAAAPGEPCLPCPCSNSSSTGSCHTDPSGSPVCDQCLLHFTGPQCSHCQAGLYTSSGRCVPCDCSGNADPQGNPQICHPDTGHCLRCINNTAGPQCQLCAHGFTGDARAHNCTRLTPRLGPPESRAPPTTSTLPPPTKTALTTKAAARGVPASTSSGNATSSSSQALLTSPGSPTDNTTAALPEVSWTQFNIIILAVIILVVVVLLGFVGGVYSYREYQNRKLNAPFWTIELKEDNISFSSYHDSIPNADVSGLLEDEANEVVPNGQLALTTQGNCYKA